MDAFNMRIAIARSRSFVLASAAMALGTGCGAEVYSEPVRVYPAPVDTNAVVYVDMAPPNIEMYPHYYYGTGYAYYVDGRWYRQGPGGWGYYRQEPPQLARQRPYVQQAPEVARARPYVQQRPYVQVAPAAPRETPYIAPRSGVTEEQPRSLEVQRARPRSER
jgi:hypothetical protein